MLPHWPVFNVADICINVAAAIIVLQAFRGVGVDGRRHARDAHEHPTTMLTPIRSPQGPR